MSGLPEDADDDDIYAMFESERIGGGTVEQMRRPTVTSALITFGDDAGKLSNVLLLLLGIILTSHK